MNIPCTCIKYTYPYRSLTRPADVDVHAVVLDLALRWCRSHRVQAQVGGVQMLLCPLPMIQLSRHVQNGLFLKLHKNTRRHTSNRPMISTDKLRE